MVRSLAAPCPPIAQRDHTNSRATEPQTTTGACPQQQFHQGTPTTPFYCPSSLHQREVRADPASLGKAAVVFIFLSQSFSVFLFIFKTVIEGTLATCPNLTELRINNNRLASLSEISDMKTLRLLFCENNQLGDMREFAKLKLLTVCSKALLPPYVCTNTVQNKH